MATNQLHTQVLQLSKVKVPCEIVYKTQVGSTSIEKGIIRDVFSRNRQDFLILESGLPILIASILAINRMEG